MSSTSERSPLKDSARFAEAPADEGSGIARRIRWSVLTWLTLALGLMFQSIPFGLLSLVVLLFSSLSVREMLYASNPAPWSAYVYLIYLALGSGAVLGCVATLLGLTSSVLALRAMSASMRWGRSLSELGPEQAATVLLKRWISMAGCGTLALLLAGLALLIWGVIVGLIAWT
ncbi:MAG: hypothetical protein EA397_07070 [Deltaproteobacteria bacterium]|nr:MAG: hypothetical protein EA397_07070 [Deltaproteobacteria bacterium]